MAYTLNQLINPPSSDELKKQILLLLSKYGFAADDWNNGSTSRSILEADAQSLAKLWNMVATIAAGGYLDTATDGWLDLLAKSQYQLTRIPSEFTKGNMNLALDPALGGPYTITAGILIVSDGTHTYANSNAAPITLNAANKNAIVEFTAESPGANYNIVAGVIKTQDKPSQIKTPLVGLSINNDGVQGPAVAIALYLRGPFNVQGKVLTLQLTNDTNTSATQSLTFTANYPDLNTLVTAFNTLIQANAVLNTFLVASINATTGSLQLVTTKTGTNQAITILESGNANALLGLPVTRTTFLGTSGWITQSGRDQETDTSLISRCQKRWATLGTGTADAFDFWARAASPFVQKTAVYSNYLNGAVVPGAVTVYIAGSNSGLDLPPLNGTAQAVYDYIAPRMPIMSQLYVGNAITRGLGITADISIKSTADVNATIDDINAQLNAYFTSLQIGQIAYKDKIYAAINCNSNVVSSTINSPTDNFVPSKNEVVILNSTNFTTRVV